MVITTETMIDPRGVSQEGGDWLERRLHSLVRFQILLEGISSASEIGVEVIVNLGNRGELGELMSQELTRRGAVIVPDPPGCKDMMGGRFAAIAEAIRRKPDVILRTEDGKVGEMLSFECYPAVRAAAWHIRRKAVDFVTFHRGSMQGYPELQIKTEQEASRRISEVTGLTEYDSHSGPLMGTPEAMAWLIAYTGQYGRAWQSTCVLPPIRALVEGWRVGIMPLHGFRYPLAMYLAETNEPSMERKREIQSRIPDDIERYVNDMKKVGQWPPPRDFITLD